MAGITFLEEFANAGPHSAGAGGAGLTSDQADARAQASYETGYSAGWDDAVRAETEAHKRISAEFARNLQDLGFTFHEARAHVMRAFEPLLEDLIHKFVPRIAAQSLMPMVVEELMALAEQCLDTKIDLLVPPGCAHLIEPLIAENTVIPLQLTEEPSLGVGQALIRGGKLERRIDLSAATDRIIAALDALYQTEKRTQAYG